MKSKLLALLLLFFALQACDLEVIDKVQGLKDSFVKLQEEFEVTDIGVKINDASDLQVQLKNSPVADLSDAEQAEKAKEAAKIIYESYPLDEELEFISISFPTEEKDGIVSTVESGTVYKFSLTEIREAISADADSTK